MYFTRKMNLVLLILLSVALIGVADNNLEGLIKKENVALGGEQKLNNSLNETELEVKIRQKIEKELEDKNEFCGYNVEDNMGLPQKRSWWYIGLMYLPNRLVDLSDIFTINAGVGPEASVEINFTKWGQFGIGYGDRYFIEKGFNRQYGGAYSSGYNGAFICWSSEEQVVDYVYGTVKPYVKLNQDNSSIPCPCKEPYKSKLVDFWRIGFRAGWIINLGFYIHPTAIANFLTGFCFVRVTNTNEL